MTHRTTGPSSPRTGGTPRRPPSIAIVFSSVLAGSPPLSERRAVPAPKSGRALRRPAAAPGHCKPWRDGQSLGAMLPYPYDFAIRIASHDGVRAHPIDPTGNRMASRAISQFATGYGRFRSMVSLGRSPGRNPDAAGPGLQGYRATTDQRGWPTLPFAARAPR